MIRRPAVFVVAALLALPSVAVAAKLAAEREQRIEEVRAAELAFAAAVAARDRAAFAAALDPDAVFVNGGGIHRGRDEILEAWSSYFAPDGPRLEWRPEMVELSGDGELGYTRGPWVWRGVGADGATAELAGVFNSVWRRRAGGDWRIVLDAGCDACPSCDD
jgi:ketosteroid isomerase-like protein